MTTFRKTLLATAAGLGAAACGGPSEPLSTLVRDEPAPVTGHRITRETLPQKPIATVEESLAALRSLRIFEVGELVMNVPAEAFFCYGQCPGSEETIAAARARQPERLEQLVAIARKASGEAPAEATDAQEIAANLRLLNGLQIVSVTDLVHEEPFYSGHCYGICPEDQAAADAVNRERAAKLARIAAAAKDL